MTGGSAEFMVLLGFFSSLVQNGSSVKLHATDCGFITFALALCLLEWFCFNGLNRPESLDKQEFSRGVAGSDRGEAGWKWQVFVVILGPYVSNLRALCTLA